MKHLPRFRALHPIRMQRAAQKEQVAYTSIVELDMFEGRTDRLSEAKVSGTELLFRQRAGEESTCSTVRKNLQPDRYEREKIGWLH